MGKITEELKISEEGEKGNGYLMTELKRVEEILIFQAEKYGYLFSNS